MNQRIQISVISPERISNGLIQETLADIGHIREFPNLEVWYDACAAERGPELIIIENAPLDMVVERLNALCARAGWEPTVVSICASETSSEIIRRALERGVRDIFIAPVPRSLFRAKIQYLVGLRAPVPDTTAGKAFDPELVGDLTMKEYRILRAIMSEPQMIINRRQLMKKVWSDSPISTKTVDVHLFNLRRKIRRHGFDIRSRLEGSDAEDARCFQLSRLDAFNRNSELKSSN